MVEPTALRLPLQTAEVLLLGPRAPGFSLGCKPTAVSEGHLLAAPTSSLSSVSTRSVTHSKRPPGASPPSFRGSSVAEFCASPKKVLGCWQAVRWRAAQTQARLALWQHEGQKYKPAQTDEWACLRIRLKTQPPVWWVMHAMHAEVHT